METSGGTTDVWTRRRYDPEAVWAYQPLQLHDVPVNAAETGTEGTRHPIDVFVDSKLRESPVFGRPITEYASKARSAQQYRDLARELMTCLKVMI